MSQRRRAQKHLTKSPNVDNTTKRKLRQKLAGIERLLMKSYSDHQQYEER